MTYRNSSKSAGAEAASQRVGPLGLWCSATRGLAGSMMSRNIWHIETLQNLQVQKPQVKGWDPWVPDVRPLQALPGSMMLGHVRPHVAVYDVGRAWQSAQDKRKIGPTAKATIDSLAGKARDQSSPLWTRQPCHSNFGAIGWCGCGWMVGTAKKRRRMQGFLTLRCKKCKWASKLFKISYSLFKKGVGLAWSSLLQVRTSQHTHVTCS